ncbi:Zinc/iron permease [Cokeromyces recurvatus]|uniref:Zinc/iron permease n=1 Tax=Cokeromyces recurvatus TaxID=90255 RepID=UPI002220242E|nr:Zinc/iron permease [Cokeromyces recurvatus]KAI7897608.1 Zinc/iron permease [Cokeromyces recurvatus]
MIEYKKFILACALLLFINQPDYVSAEGVAIGNADECEGHPVEDYHLGIRIGSIFIIMVTSALGTYAPIVLHRVSPYEHGGPRDWILTVGKFFGTGIILATAFVHMLPRGFRNFYSPCLTAGWLSYGAFAGIFCMISSFGLQLLEIASVSHMNKYIKRKRDAEMGQSINEFNEKVPTSNEKQISHSHMGDTHAHAHSAFLDGEDSYKHLGTYILELGIAIHSILIGIAMANTGNDTFITLLIALVFHQFFEGMALGTRLNEIPFKTWYKPIALGFLYIWMTPIGIAIGVGLHSTFNSNSFSSVLSSAILDSLSAGILLYNAYVSLMSMEMSHNTAFHQESTGRKTICFLSMYIGAGIMSLIGKWC